MPFEIGLQSSQQDSFEHHEELRKLSTETDVFYVPLRNEYGEHGLHTNQDLTKRFDEDLSNKHLIVTFRDIGYSLFLDSVESLPDENDHSKIRVSGKMIVDGICIQFFGCFEHGLKTEKPLNISTQQINGVGRVVLDENYYRELSTTQILNENSLKSEDNDKKETVIVQPIIVHKTRQQTAKLKERSDALLLTNKPKPRSRTISESIPLKTQSNSPPPSSIITTSKQRIHSPTHMPYPLRSPRAKHHRIYSPVHQQPSKSEILSSVPPPPSTITTHLDYSSSSSIDSSQIARIQMLSQTTMPIPIPTPSNTHPLAPPASLPQLNNLFPLTQSHSLPTYFFPTNVAYIASTNNPTSSTPFEFSALPANTSMLLITNSGQHPTQPVHILTPIDHRAFQFAHFNPTSLFPPPPPPPSLSSHHPIIPSRTCNILDTMSNLQSKRPDNETQTIELTKQSSEQLPFKKRRYTDQQLQTTISHDDDDEVSNESVKK